MRELYSNDSFIINDYTDIYIYIYIYIIHVYIYIYMLSRMVDVMCAINVLDLSQRAMLNGLIGELTWRDTKMISIHIFGQNQSILL